MFISPISSKQLGSPNFEIFQSANLLYHKTCPYFLQNMAWLKEGDVKSQPYGLLSSTLGSLLSQSKYSVVVKLTTSLYCSWLSCLARTREKTKCLRLKSPWGAFTYDVRFLGR